ncbi:ABC transporter substrate-binding protein [Flavobacterium sp. 7A]|uniref:ABC transporter substrate-binding protein n=1 Tax=Flavobacterium sp. 7A TaxID=2940571 RepID=UPI002227719D|nr:helical backbone metal receptor [Flavobacterium sp. 7A]MCW2118959.1 ABC-type Fe3+-hydroxamate transport system substrate-binding protein [Flavobacterium sp. 7A]
MKKLTFTDQLGTVHFFSKMPQRIISLVPSQTELLHDLGLEMQLIGITKFCVHPYHLQSTKIKIGGTKKVHYEKIRLLEPDIIICNKEENTKEIVEKLSEICPVWVTDIRTIKDNFQMISDFGQLFNRRVEARKWNDKLAFGLRNFKSFIQDQPIKKVAYFIWKNPYMVAGSDTYIDELLQLNHFENVFGTINRYPQVTVPQLIDAKPEIIMLSSEPYPFKKEDGYQLQPDLSTTQFVVVDGEMFSWYGTRLLKAFEYFQMIHTSFR